MHLDGETRLIPILGDPIAQVKSPALLSEGLAARGLNAIVPPVHARPADFAAVVTGLKRVGNVDGLVITVPHKFTASEVCDDADNDCDGIVDEDGPGVWYADDDGDGFGDPDSTTTSCDPPPGFVDNDEM